MKPNLTIKTVYHMKKCLVAMCFLSLISNKANADFNNNQGAIGILKDDWVIPYIDNLGEFTVTGLHIKDLKFSLIDGYWGLGVNTIDSTLNVFFGDVYATPTNVGCFYTEYPAIYEPYKYKCFDNESDHIIYYNFNIENGLMKGFFRVNHEPYFKDENKSIVNKDFAFTGYNRTKNPNVTYQFGDYISTYNLIQWLSIDGSISNDYCLDIADENWNIYPGLQAIKCGKDIANFSPRDYVTNVMQGTLPIGFKFNWRVWSKTSKGETFYGGQGFEGTVIVD
jgi:hypothetical protein